MVLGASAVSFGFLMPASSESTANARVFSEGLSIVLDRNSPAFAALEDSTNTDSASEKSKNLNDHDEVIPPGRQNQLVAGSDSSHRPIARLGEKILRANRREAALAAQERQAREALGQALAQAAAETLAKMAENLRNQPMPSPSGKSGGSDEQKPIAVASNKVKTISLSEMKMSREQLLGSLFLPMAVSDSSSDQMRDEREQEPARKAYARGEPPSSKPRPASMTPEKDFEPPANMHQVTISGNLEFADGVALSNTMDRVVVYREIDGEPAESGAVWLRQGRYEIFVEENVGQLIGELKTPYGDVIGRGAVDITRVRPTSTNSHSFEGVTLKIRPVSSGIIGHVVASSSDSDSQMRSLLAGTEVFFQDVPIVTRSKKDGTFEEPRFLDGSNAFIHIQRPGLFGTLAFASTQTDNTIEAIPTHDDRMVQRLIAMMTAEGIQNSKSSAVIFGRVHQHGKPRSGARVEILTSSKEQRAIYFNSALQPDLRLTETTSNGLYAFFPVPTGTHALQVTVGEEIMTEPLIFPTASSSISNVNVEISNLRHAKVKVFHAFKTDLPMPARLSSPGSERTIDIDRSGTGAIQFAGSNTPFVLDAQIDDDHEKVRISMGRELRALYVPMLPKQWLLEIKRSLHLSDSSGGGTIVGFIQGAVPYRVSLDERSKSTNMKIVYFNNRGELLESDFGQPGGGFIIFNAPDGFHTVTVQPSGFPKIYTSVHLVDKSVTNVLSHWIR